MHASGAWWSSDYNIGAALTMDVYIWLVRILDQKLTSEHNSYVNYRHNPKAETPIPKLLNVEKGETYANSLAGARLARLMNIKVQKDTASGHQDAIDALRDVFTVGRKMRGEA